MHLDSEGQPLRWLRTDKAVHILRKLESEKVNAYGSKREFKQVLPNLLKEDDVDYGEGFSLPFCCHRQTCLQRRKGYENVLPPLSFIMAGLA